ncbi:hypothetical protein H8699_09035 [Christensenellaceae bacterium NSJ-44]|uniref:asparagine synthase (glutamine-hydrolyzing) n=1 Tax=Luoshenia tenuis TaxID=2763654 RepID=A0A926D0L9_9FIRM|nr:hypothetical protein [Luoshenia tenuis]MBC8529568.1 hypothetical protein [Luoshenia tenuis]
MNIQIKLNHNAGYRWWVQGAVAAKGFAYISGKLYQDQELADYLNNMGQQQAIVNILEQMAGQFAFVIRAPGMFLAAVDHIRSFPLFYEEMKSGLDITDELREKRIAKSGLDEEQIDFLQHSLYTLENKTLLRNVKQIPAGRYLTLENGKSVLKEYWRFSYADQQITNQCEAVNEIAKGYEDVFSKCAELLQGRTAVVPLSGGYDSRLVVQKLLDAGIPKERIVAYTYGDEKMTDVVISKRVAQAYGIRHYFVPYNKKETVPFFNKQFRTLVLQAGNASSLPCVQEWYAVHVLKQMGILNGSCVMVPGYGGILPGHYMKEELLTPQKQWRELIGRFIKKDFLGVSPMKSAEQGEKLKDLIMSSSYFKGLKEDGADLGYVMAYERYIYQEEQSKFIQNAVRCYEMEGMAWLTPFLFKEQFATWGKLDNHLRLHNQAFFAYTQEAFDETAKAIPFTGSKVRREKKNVPVPISKIGTLARLIFKREKIHYLLALVPFPIYFRSGIKKRWGINDIIGQEYIRVLREIAGRERRE